MNRKIVILVILALLIGAGVYYKWMSLHQPAVIGPAIESASVQKID